MDGRSTNCGSCGSRAQPGSRDLWGRWLDGRFSKGFLINAESPAPSVCLWAWSLEVGRIAMGGKQSFKQEPTAGTDAPGLRRRMVWNFTMSTSLNCRARTRRFFLSLAASSDVSLKSAHLPRQKCLHAPRLSSRPRFQSTSSPRRHRYVPNTHSLR